MRLGTATRSTTAGRHRRRLGGCARQGLGGCARRGLGGCARQGLTLLELVVVLAILVALSGLVVPLIQGLGYQTNASTNAAVAGDVDRAVGTFHTRFDKYPNEWDSLLTASDTLYSKLHPNLAGASPPILRTAALSGLQADSLQGMGIYQLRDHDESGTLTPNTTGTTPRTIAAGTTVLMLDESSLTSATAPSDMVKLRDLAVTDLVDASNYLDYVVVGLGTSTTIRGSVMTDAPMVHGSDPSRYYSRVLCVFMVPGTGTGATAFPAKYVGCFLPDGTSLRSNLERYHNTGLD